MNNKDKGALGELLAAKSMERHGYTILDRNYRRKWGELDIVAEKDGIIHFVEVKSVGRRYESEKDDLHKPEENVHRFKLHQISKMIQIYISERGITRETLFEFHVACVFLDLVSRKGRVKWLKNIIL